MRKPCDNIVCAATGVHIALCIQSYKHRCFFGYEFIIWNRLGSVPRGMGQIVKRKTPFYIPQNKYH